VENICYLKWQAKGDNLMVEKRTYARVGLMGNPSDGFYGKTLSACIRNFHAKVVLMESPKLVIIPHNIFDPTEFFSLQDLEETSKRDGYYGGIRLIYATCKRFSEYCRENGIVLEERNFTVIYDTNIPRQVGLGGSSAIIVSLLHALMEFYGLTDQDIPLEIQPNLVLSVETEELGIKAGLQDRVIQTYGGAVYMDFDEEIMEDLGHGLYERIDPNLLPNMFLAYIEGSGKDSGKMHNEVRFRFNRGDRDIIDAMSEFAGFAFEAKEALECGNYDYFGVLMDMNFDLRRKIYGDKAIGHRDLKMITIARSLGAPIKFPGSGGAVVGMYEDMEQFRKLKEKYVSQGFKFAGIDFDNSHLLQTVDDGDNKIWSDHMALLRD
jgi:glucuronokinase